MAYTHKIYNITILLINYFLIYFIFLILLLMFDENINNFKSFDIIGIMQIK